MAHGYNFRKRKLGYFAIAVMLLVMAGCTQHGRSASPATLAPNDEALANSSADFPLVKVGFMDNQHGWARATNRNGKAQLLVTEDSGSHWKQVTPPNLHDVASMFFLDRNTAWVVDQVQSQRVVVLHTANGGQNWSEASIPVDASSGADVFFTDPNVGWLMAHLAGMGHDSITLYRTTNGGTSWEILQSIADQRNPSDKVASIGGKFGPVFRDAMTGWIGSSPTTSGEARLYMTTDGGATWKLQQLRLPADTDRFLASTAVPQFVSKGQAVLPVLWYPGNESTILDLFRSDDGGATWTSSSQLSIPTTTPVQVVMADSRRGWAWSNSSAGSAQRFQTSDGGATWEAWAPDFRGDIAQLNFVTADQGWALFAYSGSDHLWRTADSGHTWEQVYPPRSQK